VAVLGVLAVLGQTAAGYHREVGELVQSLGIDAVLGVGDLARDYGGELASDADEAVRKVKEIVKPGDVVLVKGSRAVGLEVVAEALTGVPA
jgi:UDP-N-acetylmuramoyl-tripeptide--D-alanyl-D-alanine ligase